MSRTVISFAILALQFANLAEGQTTFIPAGTTWKYLDNGSNQGTAWRTSALNDSTWASGTAELGYGDGDETTVISYGPNSNNKYITTYFRKTFTVANPAAYTKLLISLLRDDGAVVYLNGTEIARSNMPSGTIDFTTRAPEAVGFDQEYTWYNYLADAALLQAGSNLLAVEIHQSSPTSSDISFNLSLIDATNTTLKLTRGPYLQSNNPGGITIRWRTNIPSSSRVDYGSSALQLAQSAVDMSPTTEHIVILTGLEADTKYYYAVGDMETLIAGDNANYYFVTHPHEGTVRPTRVWVLGDSGTGNADAAAVRDAYLHYTGNTPTDFLLMLGDNAYTNGTDLQYQTAVFDLFASVLRKMTLWPTLGNHDALSADSPTQSGTYYNIFSLPKMGEAGGLASNTEAYYSFNYANIHFVCLDSEDSDRSPTGPMLTWLRNDLAANKQQWIIAFCHHPPYSKGSHDSDDPTDSEGRMRDIRENAVPLLEAGGADLLLVGHSHGYERSILINGHYGLSSTFNSSMIKNGGNGRRRGDGAYVKPSAGPAPNEGTAYIVAGSSGQLTAGAFNHPIMFTSQLVLGSLMLDIQANELRVHFITSTRAVNDCFTMYKGVLSGPADLNCDGGTNVLDIPPFVLTLLDPAEYANLYPTCHLENADLNADHTIDGRDIAPFISQLLAAECPE